MLLLLLIGAGSGVPPAPPPFDPRGRVRVSDQATARAAVQTIAVSVAQPSDQATSGVQTGDS